MRYTKILLPGLIAAGLVGCGLVGCGNSAPGNSAAGAAAATPASMRPAPDQTGPAEPHAQTGAQAAALRFDRAYQAGHYTASWELLVPAMQRQIPRRLWVRVHQGCQSATAAMAARAIRAVTVFGTAAIVTETVTAGSPQHRRAEEVFSYIKGQWGYSPNDLDIYHHGSAAADIAAARAAGLCASWKSF
jgi:hypothetical protein